MRIACGIEYDGAAFCGWQRQYQGHRTIQDVVETALTGVANHPVSTICAGRTDAGVHATSQVVHFDTSARRSEKAWVMGSNSALPDDVRLRWALPVPDAFHARYSATSRRYRYAILEGWNRSALWRNRAAWSHCRLDDDCMRAAATALVGEHDFSAFRSARCQADHPIRRVHSIRVGRNGHLLLIDVHANAFLHNMVRIIVGCLIAIGRGEQQTDWLARLLQAGDRTQGAMTAAPDGLYFIGPTYSAEFRLPPPWPGIWPETEPPIDDLATTGDQTL